MLLMCSIPGFAYNVTNESHTITIDDDVPIWENGDLWRYEINRLYFSLNQSGQAMSLDLSLNELMINVIGQTTTSYQMGLSGNIAGIFDYNDGAGTTLGGILFITKVSGNLNILKENLASKEANIVIKSIALLLEHPIMLPIPIPVPLTITINIIQDVPRPLIDFPLYDGKEGIIPETTLSTNLRVESIVLKILHAFFSDIPEEIYIEQDINLPMLLYSANEEEISVSGVTYTAYNLEFFQGLLGSLYYAPSAGNYIKAVAEIDTGDIKLEIDGELVETTYS